MIMMHSDMRTFVNHYLNRRVTVDTQAIVHGVDPQDNIIKAACRISRWIDPDCPWKLTTKQSLSINSDPRLRKLLQRQAKLKGQELQQDEYKKLGERICSERQRLRKELLASTRRNWVQEAAEREIRLQLSGKEFRSKLREDLERPADKTPQHVRLIETILSLPACTIEKETERRSAAIRAIVNYCDIQEGDTPRFQRSKTSTVRRTATQDDTAVFEVTVDRTDTALEEAIKAVT